MRRTPEGTRRAAIALAALAVVLSLSGCFADEEPVPTTTPVPSSTPIFATEEEALAAAEEAYANYQDLETVIFSNGGKGSAEIKDVATRSALEEALAGFSRFEEDGLHSTGEPDFTITDLQYVSDTGANGEDVLGAYLCLDVSRVDVVDSNGNSVVSPDRADVQGYEVSFDHRGDESTALILSSRTIWTGADLCD